MRTFLIQTIDGKVKHDFSFYLLEAIDYQNWYYNEKRYDVILSDTYEIENCIPIGSVEFVLSYLKKYHGIGLVKPINIPSELMKPDFLKRQVEIIDTNIKLIIITNEPLFIKDNRQIKGFTDIITFSEGLNGEFLVSELIDIDSEWRGFVYDKKLVGLQIYSSDFTLFPDVNLIKEMIKEYTNCPPAYTIDVGVSEASPTSNRKVKWGLLASSTVPENRSYAMSTSVTSGASLPTIHLPLSLRLEEGSILA